MKAILKKLNALMFSTIVSQMSNVSSMIKDVTLLDDLRHNLKILSSNEYETKFFEETKQNAYKQPFRNFDFIVSAYREEILKKQKGE